MVHEFAERIFVILFAVTSKHCGVPAPTEIRIAELIENLRLLSFVFLLLVVVFEGDRNGDRNWKYYGGADLFHDMPRMVNNISYSS